MNNFSKPLVSVVMITYKHENFIAEAIEGVLMQEVDFDVELIIADDCSPDGTEKIVQDFIANHPNGHWIKYHRHEKNIGMMPNFMWALEKAKGKYIALCEGDDYWIDPKKLQVQYAILENESSYSACFHQASILGNDKLPSVFPDLLKNQIYLSDVINEWIIPTASLFFRKKIMDIPSQNLNKIISGDRLIHILCANQGSLYFDKKVMAIYRLNEQSVTVNNNQYHGLEGLKNFIQLLKTIEHLLTIQNKIIKDDFIEKSSLFIIKQEKKFFNKWKLTYISYNSKLNWKGKLLFLLS